MSSYNPPTELLPRFNTKVFIQNANVSYPVAQGAITIPNQITIVNGSNTIIITPTSIIINGNPFSFANIAYLNLNQTFTGINTFTQKIIGFLDTNTPSVSITQFSSLTTGTLYIAPTITIGNINIGCSSIDSITGITNGNINIGNCRSFGGNLTLGNLYNNSYLNGAIVYIGNSISTSYLYGNTHIDNLLTNVINPTISTSVLQIATNSSTADVIIASGTTGNVTLGGNYVTTLYLLGQSVIIGVTLSGNSITLSTDTSCNGIFTAQTIRATTLSSPVKLFDNSTGTITIGNSSATNTINGNTTFPDGINVKTIRTANATDSVTLYDTTTGAITFGNSSSSATTTFSTNTNFTKTNNTFVSIFTLAIDSVSLSNNVNLYSYPTTATINLCKGLTTGNFILCGNTSFAGTITIGGASGTNTIKGNTTISNTLLVDTLTSISASDTINLYTSSTGTISLATSNNVINVGTSSTGNLTLGSTTLTSFTINSPSITIGTINVSSTTLNGTLTIPNQLRIKSIEATTATDLVNLYTTLLNALTIGSSSLNTLNLNSQNTNITGNVLMTSVSTNTISGKLVGDTITLYGTTTTGNISFATGLSSGTLTIGNSSASNTIKGNTTISNTLYTNTISSILSTDTANLYTSTQGALNIGNVGSITTINGQYTAVNGSILLNTSNILYANTIRTYTTTDNIALYNNTTGTLTIGNTSSSSAVYLRGSNIVIGNTSGGQTKIYNIITNSIEPITTTGNCILYSTATGNLTLGGTSTTYTNIYGQNIAIGTSGSLNTITGNTTISNTLLADTLTGVLASDNISLYNTSTTGNINFATGITSGSINIGNPSQSGTTSIYSSTSGISNLFTNSTTGSINIGSPTSTTFISNIGGKNVITNTSVSSISTSTSGLSFKNICMSANGEIAYIFNGVNIYRTSNSGATWVLQYSGSPATISGICCSYTGQFVYYSVSGTTSPRYSNNFGQTFTATSGLSPQGTHSIWCSLDGSIVCLINSVSVSLKFVPYFNTTYGVSSTWSVGYPLTSASSTINSALIIGSLGTISDVIVATGSSSYNDYIYYSTTPTTSWSQATTTGPSTGIWSSLSYSPGGAGGAIIYVSSGLTGSNGGLYLSSNTGASFISLPSTSGSINWVSSSYDNTIISYVSSAGFSLSTNGGLGFTSYSTTPFSYMAMSQSSKNVLLVPTSITDAIYQFNTNQNLNVNCDFIIPKQRMTLQSNTENNYGNNTNVFYPYRTMFLGLSSSNNATLTYPLYENYIMTPQGASVITLPALKEYSVGLKLTFTKIALQTLNFTTTSPDLII